MFLYLPLAGLAASALALSVGLALGDFIKPTAIRTRIITTASTPMRDWSPAHYWRPHKLSWA